MAKPRPKVSIFYAEPPKKKLKQSAECQPLCSPINMSATPWRQCRMSNTTTPQAASQRRSPPPIQRQDSARWYASVPQIKRQIPLGEEFAKVMEDRTAARKQMVRGASVELTYLFSLPGNAGQIPSGTTGRISRRIAGGWLQVKFEGHDKSIKVRTSNCNWISGISK